MRIGIDARFFGGEQSKGLGRYTQKLLQYLLELDPVNQYVIFVPPDLAKQWPYPKPNVTLVPAPYPWYSMSEQAWLPFKLWRAKLDFVHFPHFNVPLLYRQPFVVTIHDLIISRFPTERATTLGPIMYRIKQLAYNRVIRHAALHAKQVITVSQYSKHDLMDYFHLPEERITVTYEGVDQFKTQATQTDRYQIKKPYLLYVGNAYPHKNLETLIEVMRVLKKRNSPIRLVFVGKSDYFYQRLQQLAWAKDVDQVTQFVGFVPDADLPALYQGALAYVFPSKYEGFGLPPLEAMHYGTPVISSNASCLPEVLGQAAAYFEYQDISGIISHIERLQTDTMFRNGLIERGRQQVMHYQWSRTAEQTLAVYEQITQSKT